MSEIALEVALIFLLILLNGVLAMSEIATVSARKVRLQQRAEAGDAGARAALALADEPGRFLSTVQIGITLVGILAGAFGGAALSARLVPVLTAVPVLAPYSEAVAFGLVVVAITYFSLVFGELVPKRLALLDAEGIAARVARPMRLLSTIAAPAVSLLSGSTDTVLRALRVRPSDEPAVSEEEVLVLVRQGTHAGVFDRIEQELIEAALALGDRRVVELMTPRPLVVWLDPQDPLEESWRLAAASPHAYFPVCRDDLDNVEGIVSVRELWARSIAGEQPTLASGLLPPVFIPEYAPALKALELFKQSGAPIALVVDEHGSIEGLITLTDVLESLVGEVTIPGQPAEQRAVRREDGSWLLDGLLAIDEVEEILGLAALPEDEDEYRTLGGLVQAHLGRIPATGDVFDLAGWRFEVVDMDGRRVDKVLATPPAAEEPAAVEEPTADTPAARSGE